MTDESQRFCGDIAMREIVALAGGDGAGGVVRIDAHLIDHPEDPRLHFLKGSLLIELGRLVEAHESMSRAIELAPDFDIARFQLGFFELTSGEADRAIATWGALKDLPASHPLPMFVTGLEHLVADRFRECIEHLRAGIDANRDNAPLNRDMELIIAKCEEILAGKDAGSSGGPGDAVSAVSLLLGNRRP
ncbi:MAG TPA: hypothetical protein VJM34_11125 [Novosphingobium sp.]|nr:hypothetical protein [Novosphingobium sp.]